MAAAICASLLLLSVAARREVLALPDGGPDGGPALSDALPGSTIPSAFRPGGWTGVPSDLIGAPRLSNGEMIVADYPFDDRGADSDLLPEVADHSNRLEDVLPDFTTTIDGRSAADGAMGDTRYPDDVVVGAADIVETRFAADSEAWYVLIQLNALQDPSRTGFELRVDQDTFINVRGLTGDVDGRPIDVAANAAQDVFELRIPLTVLDPGSGTHGVLVASGVWDPATQDWYKAQTNLNFKPFYDVAYVPDENASSYWNERLQSQHISVQAFSRDVIPVDLDLLRAPPCDTPVCADVHTYGGLEIRMIRSGQQLGEGVVTDPRGPALSVEGARRYLSAFQPYAMHAPTDFAKPHPLVILLHPAGGNYMSYLLTAWQGIRPWAEEMDAVVAMPFARGEAGTYDRDAEKAVFEVWRDVARHYPVDRERVYVMGVGEGGQGALRLAHMYPDQFAGVIAWAAPWEPAGAATCRALQSLPVSSTCPQTLIDIVGNARNVPVLLVNGALDERTPVTFVREWATMIRENGTPYRLVLYPAQGGHIGYPATDGALVRDWLGGLPSRVRRPAVVTYRVARDLLQPGAERKGAYWITDVDLAPSATDGAITASLAANIAPGEAYGPELAGTALTTSIVEGREPAQAEPSSNYLHIDASRLTAVDVAFTEIGWDLTEAGTVAGTSDTVADVLLRGLRPEDVVAVGVASEFTPDGLLLHVPAAAFTVTLNPA